MKTFFVESRKANEGTETSWACTVSGNGDDLHFSDPSEENAIVTALNALPPHSSIQIAPSPTLKSEFERLAYRHKQGLLKSVHGSPLFSLSSAIKRHANISVKERPTKFVEGRYAKSPNGEEVGPDNEHPFLIVADGSCLVKPHHQRGPGGWAAIIVNGPEQSSTTLTGAVKDVTSGDMEATALVEALHSLGSQPPGTQINLVTDSNDAQRVIENAQRLASDPTAISDPYAEKLERQPVWKTLTEAIKPYNVTVYWNPGHSTDTHALHEKVDMLCREEAKKLRDGEISSGYTNLVTTRSPSNAITR